MILITILLLLVAVLLMTIEKQNRGLLLRRRERVGQPEQRVTLPVVFDSYLAVGWLFYHLLQILRLLILLLGGVCTALGGRCNAYIRTKLLLSLAFRDAGAFDDKAPRLLLCDGNIWAAIAASLSYAIMAHISIRNVVIWPSPHHVFPHKVTFLLG